MGIDEVGYNRKDIETNLGYIFNVPDDYELNESSDNHLFGIIEIPYDIFNDKEDEITISPELEREFLSNNETDDDNDDESEDFK